MLLVGVAMHVELLSPEPNLPLAARTVKQIWPVAENRSTIAARAGVVVRKVAGVPAIER
jgi:hypothetical protein